MTFIKIDASAKVPHLLILKKKSSFRFSTYFRNLSNSIAFYGIYAKNDRNILRREKYFLRKTDSNILTFCVLAQHF